MADMLERLSLALADRYTLERELGEGGMAIVFLADDRKVNRKVAIKVLRPELAAAIGTERFLREIEIGGQLSHPNILPVFDSGEADGFLYYVMPFVEGESLRDRLNRETQLPVDDAIQITKEVADALGHSHAKDIMHRDIKPENILLSGGHAIVADFGIARAVTMAGGEKLTQTGMAIGTPEYMSPEQATGTKNVDHRTDIYALACVAYEMLAGEPPYTGPTVQAIIAKRFSDPVPSIRRVRTAVSEEIDAAIEKALDKTPADRFQSTEQFIDALTGERPVRTTARRSGDARWKRWAAAGVAAALVTAIGVGLALGRSGGIDPNSIVVLPFRNGSSDPEQEFMSDGIAEELLNLLAQIPELKVISRTTAFSFKGRDDVTIPEIAAQLRVAHVLEGSVRTDGNTIRITARLIDTRSDTHLFSGNYDGTLEDIFALQDEIAAKVVSELKVTLLGELPTLRETDPEAYTLFLQARHIADMEISQENYETAVPMFERVLEIAPDYAPAYNELAIAYLDQSSHGWRPPEEGFQMAVDAAERALSLDPDFAYARAVLGITMVLSGDDIAGGARHVERALEMDPDHPEILMAAGNVLSLLGRFDEAIPVLEYVADRDPVYLINLGNLTIAYFYAGRWGDVVATRRTILELNPGASTGPLVGALLEMGEFEEALAAVESDPDPDYRLFVLAIASYALGQQPEFESAFQEIREGFGEAFPDAVAAVYAYAGDVDAAFEWLARLASESAYPLVSFDPLFANLHDDPRWTAFVERMGQSEDQLAAISFEVRLPR